jgi:hypothetical protein
MKFWELELSKQNKSISGPQKKKILAPNTYKTAIYMLALAKYCYKCWMPPPSIRPSRRGVNKY